MPRHVIRAGTILVTSLVVFLTAAAVAAAQTPQDKWDVMVKVTHTPKDGATGKSWAGNGGPKAAGESFKATLYSNARGGGAGQGYPLSKDMFERFAHAWQVEVRVLAATLDSVTVHVDWSRHALLDGTVTRVAGDQGPVTLRDGERHIIDFVAMTPDSDYVNGLVELTATPASLPGREFAPIEYDLWMLFERPDGTQANRRLTTLSVTDWTTSFAFETLSLPIEVAEGKPRSDVLAMSALFKGTIKGWMRADGSLVLSVRIDRQLRPGPVIPFVFTSEQVFVCQFGETTRVDYPLNGWGFLTFDLPSGAKPPARVVEGVTVDGGKVRLSLRDYFGKDKAWLLVTVRPR